MRKAALVLVLASLGATSTAVAYPDEYALRPLQLPPAMVQLKVPVIINLSRNSVANPVWIPFELRLGLTHDFELRLFHPVHGLCVSGRSRGCDHVYNDLGVGMLYNVMREQGMDLALLAALEITSFSDPTLFRIDVGVAFKYVRAPFSIATWPYASIALDHRDRNDDWLNIPVEFAFQLSFPAALFFESGLYGNAHDFANSWVMPLGVGINYLPSHGFDLGAEFKLTGPIGNGGGIDGRIFLVYFAVRN